MMLKSVEEVERVKAHIIKVDAQIMQRREAIRSNTVPNAGIARNAVEILDRQNRQRKAFLHTNRGQIEALYNSRGGRAFTKLRETFLTTPDGIRHKGNRGNPTVSINDRLPKVQATPPTPPTKKQRKKESPPMVPITVEPPKVIIAPLPTVTPAKPQQRIQLAADAVRQENHRLAAERSAAIRKERDAKRDAELIARGQAKQVEARRRSELAKRKADAERAAAQRRAQLTQKITSRATSAEKTARDTAARFSKKSMTSFTKARSNFLPTRRTSGQRFKQFQPTRRSSRGSGFIPQLAVMMSLTDKRRAATVNQSTRTPSNTPQGPINDQITEDVRKHRPVKVTHTKEYYNFVKEVQMAEKEAHKIIQETLKGKGPVDVSVFDPARRKYWVNRTYALMAQLKKIALDEAIRWDQGVLSTGAAVSTDTRSQSKRRMSPEEFQMYLQQKLEPLVMPVFNEFMEEAQRAFQAKELRMQPKQHKVALNNSLAVGRQKSLATADKLRGHGRPVLSEQQGTQGLAGLFPALRSSMQGALRR
jgi:hypothetical protein